MRPLVAVAFTASLSWLAGCQNACQAACLNLATVANEDCDNGFTESEIQACVDAYATPTGDEAATCRTYGAPDSIRREWSCDDVNLYRRTGLLPDDVEGSAR